MPKKFQKTLSIGLSGLLALGIGVASAADTASPSVLHEMVPHVVLPETIQYNKTAKNLPGTGYSGVSSPYVATYVAHPSYQVPATAAFQSVGQSVYPVSPKLLPSALPAEDPEVDDFVGSDFVLQGRDVQLKENIGEPIQLAADSEYIVPMLPKPNGEVLQTSIFCQHPVKPPAAWAFSSPLFKVASVPAGWTGGQVGGISHNSPRGSQQQVGFQTNGVDPATAGSAQGVPYSMFQMGREAPEHNCGVQAQILPNGMILLTMPPNHGNCGLLRCRIGNAPRTMLLPPAPAGYSLPQQSPQSMMMSMPEMQTAFGGGMYMPVSGQQMFSQMQPIPMTVMTPTGPAVVGYQQSPMMNSMTNSMMNPMMGSQFPQFPQMPMSAMTMPNPMVAAQVAGTTAESDEETLKIPPAAANPMTLVATPFGYCAVPVSPNATQADIAAQLAQMQTMFSSQMVPANPYMYATPFGPMVMNPQFGAYGQFGGYGMPLMNAGYHQMGMSGGGQGMTVSEMLQVMALLNNNKQQQRRVRLADRLAERRENRQTNTNDPFAQLMQAWTTPYVSPDLTLRMPSRNAYPYGYFGVQASPADTANYGGYHNLYFGSTAYPGLY